MNKQAYFKMMKLYKKAQDLKTQYLAAPKPEGYTYETDMTPAQFKADYTNPRGSWRDLLQDTSVDELMDDPDVTSKVKRRFRDAWHKVHNYKLDQYNKTGVLPTFNSWNDVNKVPGLDSQTMRYWRKQGRDAYKDFNLASNTAPNTQSNTAPV